MPLPILSTHQPPPGRSDLVRFYHRTELHWSRQLAAEETPLDFGVVLFNPDLPDVADANMIFDAALSEEVSSADRAIAEAEAFFQSRGRRCRMWVLNPSAPQEQTQPLAEKLVDSGYEKRGYDIMHLASPPPGKIEEVGGLTIIPARASFRHARELSTVAAREWGRAQLGDAQVLHLEDPQTDALIAIKGGKAAALVSVLSVGDLGCIENLYVVENFRGQGIGRTMMSRAMEICMRSLFKHTFIGVNADNAAAVALYTRFGFQKVGDFVYYQMPYETRP